MEIQWPAAFEIFTYQKNKIKKKINITSQVKYAVFTSHNNSVYEQPLLSQVEMLCQEYNHSSRFPGMQQLTGLQVFLGRYPLQLPKQKNQHAAKASLR